MHSKIATSAIVFVHAALAALIAPIGCQSESGFEDVKANTNTGYGSPAASQPIAPAPDVTVVSPFQAPPAPPSDVIIHGGPDTQPTTVRIEPPRPQYAPPPPSADTYVVKNGDSLYRVAKRNGVSPRALAKANNLPDNAQLKTGQRLVIPTQGSAIRPKPAASPAAVGTTAAADASGTRFHVVKPNEFLRAIARKYGTTVAKLKEVNGITDERKVRAGQKLKVPPASARSTRPATATPAPAPDAPPLPPLEPAPLPPPGTDITIVGEPPVGEPATPPAADPGEAAATPIAAPDVAAPEPIQPLL